MDEAALSEKFEKAKRDEELEEQKKNRIISENIKKRKNLEMEIITELAKWEDKLPKGKEVTDKDPFLTDRGEKYFLLKKAAKKRFM